jgi:hypothetical protein
MGGQASRSTCAATTERCSRTSGSDSTWATWWRCLPDRRPSRLWRGVSRDYRTCSAWWRSSIVMALRAVRGVSTRAGESLSFTALELVTAAKKPVSLARGSATHALTFLLRHARLPKPGLTVTPAACMRLLRGRRRGRNRLSPRRATKRFGAPLQEPGLIETQSCAISGVGVPPSMPADSRYKRPVPQQRSNGSGEPEQRSLHGTARINDRLL